MHETAPSDGRWLRSSLVRHVDTSRPPSLDFDTVDRLSSTRSQDDHSLGFRHPDHLNRIPRSGLSLATPETNHLFTCHPIHTRTHRTFDTNTSGQLTAILNDSTSFSLSYRSPLIKHHDSFVSCAFKSPLIRHRGYFRFPISLSMFVIFVFICFHCLTNNLVLAWQTPASESNALESHLNRSASNAVISSPSTTLSTVSSASSIFDQNEPTICGNIDIRNDVKNFRKLENCTVIEGHLQIVLIDRGICELNYNPTTLFRR